MPRLEEGNRSPGALYSACALAAVLCGERATRFGPSCARGNKRSVLSAPWQDCEQAHASIHGHAHRHIDAGRG